METIRDSSLGQFIRFVSQGRFLPHQEDVPGFGTDFLQQEFDTPSALNLEKSTTLHQATTKTKDGTVLVGWYSDDDPQNPLNWSKMKKYSVATLICAYTCVVYLGAAIYAPSAPGVMEDFGVGLTASSLGLALYVLGYGVGPMLFSPLSEIPAVGRTTPYLISFSIFVVLLIPTSLVDNFAGLLVLRFLLGFFGSPGLSTAGATFQDIFPGEKMAYIIAVWASTISLGPALGPLLATFSIEHFDWHWSQWEMLMVCGPVLILMLVVLPETSSATILLRRARRLRTVTGNASVKSQSEIDQASFSVSEITFNALVIPWQINLLDPAVLFTTFFTALVYGIFYTYFEAFPLVYQGVYHFSPGTLSLAYLLCVVAQMVALPLYLAHWRYVVQPGMAKNGVGAPENFLKPGLYACFLLPAGLFIFAWTSRASVHWVVSMIGAGCVISGLFVTTQTIFLYLPFCYPKYAASLFAANSLVRSCFAFASILFAPPMFRALGIEGGVSLLAGFTLLCCGGIWVLFLKGAWLRSRSRFAVG